MKIKEMIDMVDKLTPNAYETIDKIQWLKHLDLQIYDEVISGCEGYEQISMGEYDVEQYDDTELLAPDMFSDLYRWYLEAQIGKANGETERYNNALILFQSKWQEYCNWYIRHHMPIAKKVKLW